MKASFKLITFYITIIFFLFVACKYKTFAINQRDKIGQKQGKWKVWFDDKETKLYYSGRYKNNAPRGTFKYYNRTGQIQLVEKYKRNKTIQTTYYHQNGKLDMKGTAQIILNPDTSIYQWLGQWEKFDTTGKLIEIHTYRNGQRIWVKFIR